MEKIVAVTQVVKVTIDESKLDEEFMKEFRESFYDFTSINQHIEHLAQLYARGVVDNGDFIEGYGKAIDMGIKFKIIGQEQEIET